MSINEQLKNIGLNKSEIAVYLYLLSHGVASPAHIAKGTRIARTNTYHVLKNLEESGLVGRQKKGKRFVYVAADPSATMRLLDQKREAMKEVLPDLQALHKQQVNKPVIQFFEGRKGLEELYMKSVEAQEEIHAIGSTEDMERALPGVLKKYQKAVKRKGLIFHDLLARTAEGKTRDVQAAILGALYEQRYLPEEYDNVPTDIIIWNDNVALFAFQEPLFGTLITNTHLADTFRMLFKLTWQAVKK